MLKFKYKETEEIRNLLVELDALKLMFENLQILPQIEENIRRESLLNSAVYSARVEGSPVTPEKLDDSKYLHKLEVSNLISAYKYVYSKKSPKKLSVKLIKKLHFLTMKKISFWAGKYRIEPWAIFNQAGAVVYLAPLHTKIPEMIGKLLELERNIKTVAVKSAIVQFLFEKIHPFADGNGRVGRLISTYLMNISGYGLKGLVSSEVAVDRHRERYYQALEPSTDTTDFVAFFLECYIEESKDVLKKLSLKKEVSHLDLLPLRRKEIYNIIKDHPYSSFDFISRRFAKVNLKTLHYDIGCLIKDNLIHKIGKTRGVTYLVNKSI